MKISERRLRRVIRQVISESGRTRVTKPMRAMNKPEDERSEEEKKKIAEYKRSKLREASRSHEVRADGRRVFMYDGEEYDYDTMLPTWYFDGKSLGQRFDEFGKWVKSFFK